MAGVVLAQADALHIPLKDKSVQCIISSPPYYGLRIYQGVPPRIWGGEASCLHQWEDISHTIDNNNGLASYTAQVAFNTESRYSSAPTKVCIFCGAWCGYFGLERLHDCSAWARGDDPCAQCFVCHMRTIARELWRVLRDDGCFFLNIGDSFSSGGRVGHGTSQGCKQQTNRGMNGTNDPPRAPQSPGLKPKDLAGIPWRVALALQQPYETHLIKNATDRAWLAGFVEGEGTISIRRYISRKGGKPDATRCQDGFTPFISIGNNDRELLDKCVAITGYGSVIAKDKRGMDRRGIRSRRIYYGWRVDANKAIEIIRDIYPYLLIKRKQAILAFTLDFSNKNGKKLRGWQKPLPAEEQAKRVLLKRLANAANQRQPINLPSYCQEPTIEVQPGWTLRCDIVWEKPNCFPSSVKDRPTRSHEYLFMFSKQARYFYDADALREPHLEGSIARRLRTRTGGKYLNDEQGEQPTENPHSLTVGLDDCLHPLGRNARSVWTINTESYAGAHFATFPQALVERCIRAGTSEAGCCPACSTPWVRQTTRQRMLDGHIPVTGTFARPDEPFRIPPNGVGHSRYSTHITDHGFAPACRCYCTCASVPFTDTLMPGAPSCIDCGKLTHAARQPCIVADIFVGSGTVPLAARALGRHSVGLDLSLRYLREEAKKRLGFTALDAWEGKPQQAHETRVEDLPLFQKEPTP